MTTAFPLRRDRLILIGRVFCPARGQGPAEDVHVRIGSRENGEFLKALIEEFGVFDVIIDDGSYSGRTYFEVPRRTSSDLQSEVGSKGV